MELSPLKKERGIVMNAKTHVGLLAVAAGLGFTAVSQAALLVDFKPIPTDDKFELIYDAVPSGGAARELYAGPGAQGDGSFTSTGGLTIEASGFPGLVLTDPNLAASVQPQSTSTLFHDVTLVLSNLKEDKVSGLSETPIFGVGTLYTQPLEDGNFELWSWNNPADPNPGELLLKGTIDNAVISGLAGAPAGAVLSAQVNYTGGLIYQALIAKGGQTTGDLSWSLLDITPKITKVAGNPALLGSFSANATGQFSSPAIPEPASVGLLAISMIGLAARRRRA